MQARQIHATQRLGSEWIVADGLEPGDRVVVEGVGKVRPGATVKPVAATQPAAPAMASAASKG